MTQTTTAFGQVHDSLSFFRNAYDEFAGYRAVLNRLTGLLDADAESRAMPRVELVEGTGLAIRDLTVRKPDAELLIDDLNLDLTAGDTLLIKGPSGSGKTTLLRSLADLWPYADGTVQRPLGSGSLFLSQQPYVPLGSLRTALAYPESPDVIDDDRAREMLRKVQLAHLVDQLDDDVDWSRRLSPGEQQRLGFARVLISRPKVVFLDEATSAVDEGLEHMLYELLRTELPETIVVSVSHRSTLGDFHTGELELLGAGRWSVSGLSSVHQLIGRPAQALASLRVSSPLTPHGKKPPAVTERGLWYTAFSTCPGARAVDQSVAVGRRGVDPAALRSPRPGPARASHPGWSGRPRSPRPAPPGRGSTASCAPRRRGRPEPPAGRWSASRYAGPASSGSAPRVAVTPRSASRNSPSRKLSSPAETSKRWPRSTRPAAAAAVEKPASRSSWGRPTLAGPSRPRRNVTCARWSVAISSEYRRLSGSPNTTFRPPVTRPTRPAPPISSASSPRPNTPRRLNSASR